MVELEFYADYRKELSWGNMSNTKAGLEWDALRRSWRPVDYTKLTVEQLADRRSKAEDIMKETEAQLHGLLPAAAAQHLLNRGANDLYTLIIKLAVKAPEALLGAI